MPMSPFATTFVPGREQHLVLPLSTHASRDKVQSWTSHICLPSGRAVMIEVSEPDTVISVCFRLGKSIGADPLNLRLVSGADPLGDHEHLDKEKHAELSLIITTVPVWYPQEKYQHNDKDVIKMTWWHDTWENLIDLDGGKIEYADGGTEVTDAHIISQLVIKFGFTVLHTTSRLGWDSKIFVPPEHRSSGGGFMSTSVPSWYVMDKYQRGGKDIFKIRETFSNPGGCTGDFVSGVVEFTDGTCENFESDEFIDEVDVILCSELAEEMGFTKLLCKGNGETYWLGVFAPPEHPANSKRLPIKPDLDCSSLKTEQERALSLSEKKRKTEEERALSLSEWLLTTSTTRKSQKLGLPQGYLEGNSVIGHNDSGITIRSRPLILSSHGLSHDHMILYHYTQEKAFVSINAAGKPKELWASLLQSDPDTKDVCFGDGVYATTKAPDAFVPRMLQGDHMRLEAQRLRTTESQVAICINNFTNAPNAEIERQERHIRPHLDKAAYCIPILAPRSWCTNVMVKATSAMIYGPGFTRKGELIRKDRDIWVVAQKDKFDNVINAKECVEDLFNQAQSADWSIRCNTIEYMKTEAQRGNIQALNALARALSDEEQQVRCAAVDALVSIDSQYRLPMTHWPHCKKCLDDGSSTVPEATIDVPSEEIIKRPLRVCSENGSSKVLLSLFDAIAW